MVEKLIKNYELYFIINPELSKDQVEKHLNKIETLLKKHLKAENIKSEQEGLKKLAYPVKKHTTGFYILSTFEVGYESVENIHKIERELNLNEKIVRYIIVDQTDFLKAKAKESPKEVEIKSHRELNKGKMKGKKCISTYTGVEAVDYKDIEFLNQFTSPYAKIFGRKRTGSCAKMHRKITKAIKRARHMALMPFTPNHED